MQKEVMQEVLKNLEKEGYTIEPVNVIKFNDSKRTGYSVRGDSNLGVVIYDDNIYSQYAGGTSINDITSEVISRVERPEMNLHTGVEDISDFEKISQNIIFKLGSVSMNEEYLKDKPCVKFSDLVLTFHVVMAKDNDKIGSAVVTKALKHSWGINLCDLLSNALRNTGRILPAVLTSMEDTLMGLMADKGKGCNLLETDEALDPDDMYILSNELGVAGASVIMYPTVMGKITKRMGVKKVIILPSSVHEVILIKYSEAYSLEEIRGMIMEINGAHVPEDEILSNKPYVYDVETDTIVEME